MSICMFTQENFNDFLDRLDKSLRDLPRERCLAFGAACCERALENYVSFFKSTGQGSPTVLKEVLDRVWEHVQGAQIGSGELELVRASVKHALLDNSEQESFEGAAAQEGCLCFRLLVDAVAEENCSQSVLRISSMLRDTTDMLVQQSLGIDATDPQLEEKIASHSMMIDELKRQRRYLDQLSSPNQETSLEQFRRSVQRIHPN